MRKGTDNRPDPGLPIQERSIDMLTTQSIRFVVAHQLAIVADDDQTPVLVSSFNVSSLEQWLWTKISKLNHISDLVTD